MTASPSSVVNKALRRHLSPALRQAAFERVDARNGWSWQAEQCVWVFNVRAVGNYFATSTGWPAASLTAWLGVLYTFIPPRGPLRLDPVGRLLPAEHECHMRSHLELTYSQLEYTSVLANPAERARRSIWWVAPDYSNVEIVAASIARAFSEFALPWFRRCSNFEAALEDVEAEHDCFNKFVLGTYLAGVVGDERVAQDFRLRAEREGSRIHVLPDPHHWYSLGGR